MPKREWTPEQREAARQRSLAHHQARLASGDAAATAVAEREPEPEADEPTSENVLAQLAGLFQQAAGQKQGREKAVNEALEVLGKLDPFKYPDIADNPAVMDFVEKVQQQRAKSTDVPPGTIIGTGMAAYKKPWTKADLLKGKGMPPAEAIAKGYIEWIEYRPVKNFDVTWNGIRIVWPARALGYFPKSHVDVFEQSLDADAWNEQHAAWLFNNPNVPFQMDYGTTNGPRVRAMDESKGEYYRPGAGAIDMAPSVDLLESAEEGGT